MSYLLLHFNRFLSITTDSEKGFNESRRDDPRVKRFMRSLAHFTMNSLSDLISEEENYFNVNDYLDVEFIYNATRRHRQQRFNYSFHPLQIMMRISNKFPHNITVSSSSGVFFFEPVVSDELGLCYTFNSRLASYLSPKYIAVDESSRLFPCRFLNSLLLCSFLISGNLESISRVKSLEEISYFDGDANAVTADLTHNVDVSLYSLLMSWVFPKYVHQSSGMF